MPAPYALQALRLDWERAPGHLKTALCHPLPPLDHFLSPLDRFLPSLDGFLRPLDRFFPPLDRREPPTNRRDPTRNRREPPTNRRDPTTNRREPTKSHPTRGRRGSGRGTYAAGCRRHHLETRTPTGDPQASQKTTHRMALARHGPPSRHPPAAREAFFTEYAAQNPLIPLVGIIRTDICSRTPATQSRTTLPSPSS